MVCFLVLLSLLSICYFKTEQQRIYTVILLQIVVMVSPGTILVKNRES